MYRTLFLFASFFLSLTSLYAQPSFKTTTSPIKGVFAGGIRTFFLTEDGNLFGSGSNYHGELGDGTITGKKGFVFITDNVSKIAVGGYHTMIIRNDGSLWATGHNGGGQLANNNKYTSVGFVKIMDDVEDVAAGDSHTMILKKGGKLLAVGRNESGIMGVGSKESYIFEVVHTLDSVKSVTLSEKNSFAIKFDDTLWACGSNEYGELGTGKSNLYYNKWIKIMDSVKVARSGTHTTLVVKTDGSCWGVGNSTRGWLGKGVGETHAFLNNIKANYSWSKIFDKVKDVAFGLDNAFVLTEEDVLLTTDYPFVYNKFGVVGGFVKAIDNVKLFSVAGAHAVVVQKDGTIHMVGQNIAGEMGRIKSKKGEDYYQAFELFERKKLVAD